MNYQDIIAALRNDPNFDKVKVKEALNFAIKHHRDNNHQFIAIARTITSVYPDTSATVAALLFFSFATANLKASKIQRFNTEISKIFNALTKLFQIHNTYRRDTIRETLKLLLSLEPDIGIRILLIRFAYLLNQIIFDSKVSDIECYLTIDEISKIYVPLFQEVTIENIKTALQDVCLTILQPQLRELIVTRLTEQYPNQQQLVISTINTLHDILSVVDIAYTISGRVKSCYSIAKKIVQKSSKVTELFDIIGIRVIVEEEDQCYKILDTIYNNYKHIPKRYKDFIKFPKKSGYQSLHTVIVNDSQKIEIQIRTKRMHYIALFGSASHLQYKMPSIRTNTTLHSVYDLLNKYILDILNPFIINIRLQAVRMANESVALRSEVTWLITQDIEATQLHYRFAYQEHAAYYAAEVITVNIIEVNQLSRPLVNINDRIYIDAVRALQIQEQYLANIRTNYQDHNQQYAEILLIDLPLDNMDNNYRGNQSVQNAKKSNILEVIKNNATIIPGSPIELLEKLLHPDIFQEAVTVTTHYQDIDWYSDKSDNTSNYIDTAVLVDEKLEEYQINFGDQNIHDLNSSDLDSCPKAQNTTYQFQEGAEDNTSLQIADTLNDNDHRSKDSSNDISKSKQKISSWGQDIKLNEEHIHQLNMQVNNSDKDSWRIPIKTANSIQRNEPITIDLQDEKIKDSDIETLISILKEHNITHLTLNTNEESYKIFISLLKDTNIIHLSLKRNYISEKEIEILALALRDTKITHLNLEGNQIAEDCVKTLIAILKDTQIIDLNLSGNDIGDTSIPSVENNTLTFPQDTKITYLDLGYNSMGDAEIKSLASILQNTQIIDLNLEYNHIGNSGAIALASVLKDTQITKLNLAYNQIRNSGAIELALILKDTKITQLILDGNIIDNTGIKTLISIQANTKIIINFKDQHKEIDNNMIPYDEANTQLVDIEESLYPDSNDERSSESGYGGSVCGMYEESDLQDEEPYSIPIKTFVSILQKDSNMTHLDLQNQGIKGSDIEMLIYLLNNTSITHLNLSSNDIYYKEFNTLISLLKDTSITHLDLKHNYINTFVQQELHFIEECESTFKSARIKYLDLENNAGDSFDITALTFIFKYIEVEYLNLACNRIGEEDDDMKQLANILKDTEIKHLDLQNNHINDLDIEALVAVLPRTNITHLNLNDNEITTKGAKRLINILNNTRLIKLDLKHNYIEDKDIVTDQKPVGCQIDFDDQKTIYPGDFYPGNFPKLQNITYSLQDRIEDNSSPVSQIVDKIYYSPNYDYQKRLVNEKSELLGEKFMD
ncbi:hypothetical protein [Candidatus Tisiphia endosymbiont of Nemotelus uliginosus]|uniref:hypothetical protein n=1 Tax=Candidatus Tisiphia endosymbiont of Nemotelus uliginosus TaxID=3077926 RepID=UPI0035C8AA8D